MTCTRFLSTTLILGTLVMTSSAADPTPPPTRRIDHVDTYHGTSVADPYRWLEDDVRESDDVAAWVENQNKVTFAYLKQIPQRETIEKRLTELWNYEKFGSPFKRGGRYYFYKNDGLQNQSVLYTQATLESKPNYSWTPINGRKTAPSPWPASASATMVATSPTAWPRAAPTGAPGG